MGTESRWCGRMQMRHKHDADALGSTTAAARFSSVRPTSPLVGLRAETPLPQSTRTACCRYLISSGLNGTVTMLLRHVGGFSCRQRLLLRDVSHALIGHRKRTRPVIGRGAFVRAYLVTIEARPLRAGRWHGQPIAGTTKARLPPRSWRLSRSAMENTPLRLLRLFRIRLRRKCSLVVWRPQVRFFRRERTARRCRQPLLGLMRNFSPVARLL